MTRAEQEAAIEAVLFTMGESVEVDRLALAIEEDVPTTREIVKTLMERYEAKHHGIKIIELENAYQMGTKGDCYEALLRVATTPKKHVLTDVVLETLSIIAYKQPVTRLQIETIRGVSSDHAVNKLLEYGLITELGRLDAPGHPILFGTTEEFLRTFGLTSVEDLPTVSPEKMQEFSEQARAEAADDTDGEVSVQI